MEGKIHFKITHGGVTRRFAISLCEGDLLPALKTRVERMTGAVDRPLFWKDEDSLIVLDSMEDMDAAVDYAETKNKLACVALVTGDAKKETREEAGKVEIMVVTEKESAKAFEGSAVKCNVCACYLAPSNGGRYKCMVCIDFDLCAACFAKGVHANHALLFMRDGQTVVSAKDRHGGEAFHMRVNNVSGTPKFFLDMSGDLIRAENETREHVCKPLGDRIDVKSARDAEELREKEDEERRAAFERFVMENEREEEAEKRFELGKTVAVAVDVGQNLFAVQEKSRQLKEARLAADKLDKQSEDAEVSLKNKEAAKEKKREEARKKKSEEYRKSLQYSRDEMFGIKFMTDMMPNTRGKVFTGEAKCEDQHSYSRKAMIDIGKATNIIEGSALAAAESNNILSYGSDPIKGRTHSSGVQDFIAAGKRLHALGYRGLDNHRSDSYIDDQLLQQRDCVFPARAHNAPPGLGGEHRDMNRKPPGLGGDVAPPPGLAPLTGQIRHRPGTWALDHNFAPASQRFDDIDFPDYDPTVSRAERTKQVTSPQQRPPRDLRAAYQDMLRSLDDRVDPYLASVHPGLGKFKDVNGDCILPTEQQTAQLRETGFGCDRKVTEKTGRGGDDAGLLPRPMPLDRWLENYGKACEADAIAERRRDREERQRKGAQMPDFRNGLEQFYDNSYSDDDSSNRKYALDGESAGYNAWDRGFGQPDRDQGGFGGPRGVWNEGSGRNFDRYEYTPLPRRDEGVVDRRTGANEDAIFARDRFVTDRVTRVDRSQTEKDRKLNQERAYQKASQIPAAMAIAVIDEIECMPVDEMIAKLTEYMGHLVNNTWSLKPHPRIFKAVQVHYEDELTGNIAVDLRKHLKSIRKIPHEEKNRQICQNTLARRRDLLREALLTTGTDCQYSEYAKIASELYRILLTSDYTGYDSSPEGNWDEVATGFMELDCRRDFDPPPRVASANPDKEGLFASLSRSHRCR